MQPVSRQRPRDNRTLIRLPCSQRRTKRAEKKHGGSVQEMGHSLLSTWTSPEYEYEKSMDEHAPEEIVQNS